MIKKDFTDLGERFTIRVFKQYLALWVKNRLAEKNIEISSNQEAYLQAYVEGVIEQKNVEISQLLEDEAELEQVIRALKNEVTERVLEIESLIE